MSSYDDEYEGFLNVVRIWPALAYLSWEGYINNGPGAVFLVEKNVGELWVGEAHYSPLDSIDESSEDDIKNSLMIALVSYEPSEQVVLVHQDINSMMRILTLSGDMAPPEAYSSRVNH